MGEDIDVKITPQGIWEGVKGMGRLITVLVVGVGAIISGTVTVCAYLNGISGSFKGVNDKLDQIQTRQYIQLQHSCREESDQRDFNRGILKWQNWAGNQIKSTGQNQPENPEVPDNEDYCRSILRDHDQDQDQNQNKNSAGHSLLDVPSLSAEDGTTMDSAIPSSIATNSR